MARDRVEVGVSVEQCCAVPDRDRCDQAIRESSDRRSFAATRSVHSRGDLVVGWLFEPQEAAAAEKAAQVTGLLLVARPGEELEQDEAHRRKRLVAFDCLRQPAIGRAIGRALELDPRRRVDEDHDGELR